MQHIIRRSFGGLSIQYYFRHFLFGLIFPALFLWLMYSQSGHISFRLSTTLFFIANAFLYPYARFVYESVVDFIMGDTVLITGIIFMLFAKSLSMLFCWAFSLLIAPIGLIWLYIYHSRNTPTDA